MSCSGSVDQKRLRVASAARRGCCPEHRRDARSIAPLPRAGQTQPNRFEDPSPGLTCSTRQTCRASKLPGLLAATASTSSSLPAPPGYRRGALEFIDSLTSLAPCKRIPSRRPRDGHLVRGPGHCRRVARARRQGSSRHGVSDLLTAAQAVRNPAPARLESGRHLLRNRSRRGRSPDRFRWSFGCPRWSPF